MTAALLVLTTALSGCGALRALEGEPDRDVF
jgi:cholesterol transport system auxiliary component